jgi:hypothetical protein
MPSIRKQKLKKTNLKGTCILMRKHSPKPAIDLSVRIAMQTITLPIRRRKKAKKLLKIPNYSISRCRTKLRMNRRENYDQREGILMKANSNPCKKWRS